MRLKYVVAFGSLLTIAALPGLATTAPESARPSSHSASANPALGPHDSNAPINVSSDNFAGNFQTKVGTYTGNVIVTQADYKLRADQVKVDV
ncbi:MAG TPA: LptA/OstA family protein, partial [Rhizomicrobium sp.]